MCALLVAAPTATSTGHAAGNERLHMARSGNAPLGASGAAASCAGYGGSSDCQDDETPDHAARAQPAHASPGMKGAAGRAKGGREEGEGEPHGLAGMLTKGLAARVGEAMEEAAKEVHDDGVEEELAEGGMILP